MIWLCLILCLVVVFLWAPLVSVFMKGFQLQGLKILFENTEILNAFGNSLMLAISTALVATLLGTMTAFALPKMSRFGKQLVGVGLVFPMVLPEIALGLALMVWFIQVGLPFGWLSLTAGHVAFTYSYATIVMKGNIELVDWSLKDAARDLGASHFQVFRHAIWPQIKPGVIASIVTSFSLSLDDFLISFFVKGIDQITLPIKIFSMIRFALGPEIYTLSAILFCISLASVLITQIWLTKTQRTTLSR